MAVVKFLAWALNWNMASSAPPMPAKKLLVQKESILLGPLTNASNILRKFTGYDSILFPFIVSGVCIAIIVLLPAPNR